MMRRDTAWILGCLFSAGILWPAMGQVQQADPDEAERLLDEQRERAIRELFRDFPGEVAPEDQRERMLRERERLEELQRRLIELQIDGRRGRLVIGQEQAAEPVVLDAKPYRSPWADRPRDEAVSALNDPAFAVRESAEMHLLTDDTLDEATLKALIQQARSPEQRHRLLRVAEHHMMRLMRERDFSGVNEEEDALPQAAVRRSAAVGYSYEPVLADANPHAELPGVRVIATMPGFPGHAYLRRGDIIVQIAGQGPSAQQREEGITAWMRWRISQHEAGDRIEFTVLRDGELLKLSMLAAEGQALDHMYTTDAFEAAARKQPYQSAWQAVRDEMIALMPRPTRLTPRGIEPANERD